MRTLRKRPWAELMVNMTPLIDVVFLIIIFFIIMINFTELHIRNVRLPKADEAGKSHAEKKRKIPITIKSEDLMFLDRKRVVMDELADILKQKRAKHGVQTIEIRADENVPYAIIKQVMMKMARVDITAIEFATYTEAPISLEREVSDESDLSI